MFTPDFYIDTVQNGKKTFVNTFVQHEETKDAMIKFIDAQAEYTKAAVKAGTEVGTKLVSASVKSLTDVTKMDLSKFDFTKMFKAAK